MNVAEDLPPFFPPLPSPASGNSSGVWLQVQPLEGDFDAPSQLKRQRVFDDAPSMNPSPGQRQVHGPLLPPPNHSNHPQNSQNSRVSRLFFKTRLCMKFRLGSCPYGPNCSFAHGLDELRRAPPNWPSLVAGLDGERSAGSSFSEKQRSNRHKICRKYYNGEVCPYGERCTFAHVEPGSLRESSPGIPGTTQHLAVRSLPGACDLETNGPSSSSLEGNVSHQNQKSCIWKTKYLHNWENPLGDSSAHSGQPVLPGKKRSFLGLKGLKKISNIYADWIEDFPPLPRNS